jgi:hypothetical protein
MREKITFCLSATRTNRLSPDKRCGTYRIWLEFAERVLELAI